MTSRFKIGTICRHGGDDIIEKDEPTLIHIK